MMKKIAAVAISAAALVVLLLSFGTSHTGLFNIPGGFDSNTLDDDAMTSSVNEEKWKVIGKVNVTSGKASNL